MKMESYRLFKRLKNQKEKVVEKNCSRQFPDCPPDINESCHKCPFYKKEV
jgi:hypothetical protein